MFKSHTRRRGVSVVRSGYTNDRFSSGNKNFFTPIGRISSNIPEYTSTIETVVIQQTVPQSVDCTDIVNEYNLLKNELNALKTLFSNPSTEISTVLSALQ
jgi:hypothetical protein